jgi:hypothetical protein
VGNLQYLSRLDREESEEKEKRERGILQSAKLQSAYFAVQVGEQPELQTAANPQS